MLLGSARSPTFPSSTFEVEELGRRTGVDAGEEPARAVELGLVEPERARRADLGQLARCRWPSCGLNPPKAPPNPEPG